MADAQKQENAKQESPKSPGRIRLTKIWLREPEDFPGGNTSMYSIDCTPAKSDGRQFFVAHFVPAHQVIELEWWKNEKAEPYRTRLTLANVRRFD